VEKQQEKKDRKDILKMIENPETFKVENVLNVPGPSDQVEKSKQQAIDYAEKYKKIYDNLNAKRIEINNQYEKITRNIYKIEDFAQNSIDVHSLRQRLIEDKFYISKLISDNEEKMLAKKEKEYKDARTASALHLPKKADIDIVLNSRLAFFNKVDKILKAQKEFIEYTIKGVDSIMWSLKHNLDAYKLINGIV